MDDDEQPIDLESVDQARTLLDAEEAYGDKLVARVIEVTWDGENDDSFLWSINGCTHCNAVLLYREQGFVWGRPMNDEEHCEYLTMQCFCSEKCVNEEVLDWAGRHGKDVVVGIYGF